MERMRGSPVQLMVYGFFLLLVGFLLALGMVVRVIEAGFILSFVSYMASLAGLIMGLIGAAGYMQQGR